MSRNSASRRCLAVGLLALATGLVAPAAGSTAAVAAPHTRAATPTACLERATGTGAAAARGAGGHGPDTRAVSAAEQRGIEARTRTVISQRSAERRRAAAASIGAIPVYVHVMLGRNGAGDVTARQVSQQIAVLNTTYAGRDSSAPSGSGVATGIGFYLAGTNRYVNATWHVDKASTTYRTKTRQGGRNALNIWLVDFDYLGIATFPWDYSRRPGIDGIRVQYDSLPGGGITNYDQGKTATHETGHWLGLYHTFQGGCAAPGDEVADTAAQASPSTGCPTGRDSCPAPGVDPIHNYMDYSYDSCYFTFTAGQDDRMHRMWTAYRG